MVKTLILKNDDLAFTAYHYKNKLDSAPLVLCLHGFPDGPQTFRHQVNDLLAAGYQVITATLRGYESSSIPIDGDYTITAIAGDVLAWIDQLGVKKTHLIGHDWGAAVAYAVAASAPDRFYSIATIAIPHPQRFMQKGLAKIPSQALKSWYMLFNQLPVISDYFLQRNDFAFIRYLWKKWSPSYHLSSDDWVQLRNSFSQAGVVEAMLSYYRQNASLGQMLGLKNSSSSQNMIINVPNLCITGSEDGCMDTRLFEHTILECDHPKGFKVERIDDAGHFVHLEKPAIVNKLLIDWFKSNELTGL